MSRQSIYTLFINEAICFFAYCSTLNRRTWGKRAQINPIWLSNSRKKILNEMPTKNQTRNETKHYVCVDVCILYTHARCYSLNRALESPHNFSKWKQKSISIQIRGQFVLSPQIVNQFAVSVCHDQSLFLEHSIGIQLIRGLESERIFREKYYFFTLNRSIFEIVEIFVISLSI